MYNFESEYQFKKLHKEEYSIFALTVINAIRFCYSFLCDAFDGVVCIPVSDVPADFHKIYMVYKRDQCQLHVVQEFIDFMSEFTITDSFKEPSKAPSS